MLRLRTPSLASFSFTHLRKAPLITPCRVRKTTRNSELLRRSPRRSIWTLSTQMKDSIEKPDSSALPELLIIGTGVLGTYLGKLWVDSGGTVTGETNTEVSHHRLKTVGIRPRIKQDRTSESYSLVVFCAPPSGSPDYHASVLDALKLWNKAGIFVFTSSIGVYARSEDPVTEATPTIALGESPRTDKIILSENSVLEEHGCVVRLAGLYHALRGPHSFFFSKGECNRPPNQELNLIHYQDAAYLIYQVLLDGERFRDQVLLATARPTINFKDLLLSSKESGLFEGEVKATGDESITGPTKVLDNSKTLELLSGNWSPNFNFEDFMKSGGQDWYKVSGLW